MYSIRRFSRISQKLFDRTTRNTVGNWLELKDSDIFPGARRTNDDVLGKYNQEWITDPFKNKIEVVETKGFLNDLRYLNKTVNLDRYKVSRYVNDLKKGYISIDNDNYNKGYSDRTHYLSKFSIVDKYIVYSKSISGEDRLTYRVYKPIPIDNGFTLTKIELVNCSGHRYNGKEYLDI